MKNLKYFKKEREDKVSVKHKFAEFKKEIKEVFENHNYDKLDIIEKSLDELLQSGYINRKVTSFMFLNEFSAKEINEFFYDFCGDVRPVHLGQIPEYEFHNSSAEFIDNLKYNSVCYFLWIQLAEFISALKEENINRN
ncbi:MAG: hypothetical protein JST15_02210 [Bacteroidetes bacterium]|nr:hypothetical protein [Bacteroidota bacterium]